MGKPKPVPYIDTPMDYSYALKRIEKIFHAEVGTPEGRELELLAARIEAYEDEHFPVGDVSPEVAAQFRKEQECDHRPKKCLLDPAVFCTRCGAYLGEAN